MYRSIKYLLIYLTKLWSVLLNGHLFLRSTQFCHQSFPPWNQLVLGCSVLLITFSGLLKWAYPCGPLLVTLPGKVYFSLDVIRLGSVTPPGHWHMSRTNISHSWRSSYHLPQLCSFPSAASKPYTR